MTVYDDSSRPFHQLIFYREKYIVILRLLPLPGGGEGLELLPCATDIPWTDGITVSGS